MATETTEQFLDWPTMGEVRQRTGMSERSVYRAASAGKIRTAQQPIPGRKPLPVYHPADVEALERAAMAGKTTIMLPAAMSEPRQNTPPPEFWQALVEAVARPMVGALPPAAESPPESELPPLAELRQKLIVTRAEAKRLGFTAAIMAVAISDGKLHMLRGRRYLMRELEAL